MSEIALLCQCLSNESEADNGTVKYIYMDDSTVYRFENNRMKKISKSLINRARKELSKQQSLTTKSPTEGKLKKRKSRPIQPLEEINSVDDVDSSTTEEEDSCEVFRSEQQQQEQILPKSTKNKQRKIQKTALPEHTRKSQNVSSSDIDLNEYYNNKNKMEFMNIEIQRLNNKVTKLKQYKALVNRLTGGEYGSDGALAGYKFNEPSTLGDISQDNQDSPNITFTPQSRRNDSLFLY